MSLWRSLLVAVQFLTRIPVRLRTPPTEVEVGRSLLFYPVVGLLIGAVLIAAQAVLVNVPELMRAALVLVVWVMLTGALHLDGLADTVDAFAGGRGDRERTLAIMKDPCAGPMGVTAIGLVLLVKFAAIAGMPSSSFWSALLIAPLMGRLAVPILFATTPYVRPNGLGALLARHQSRIPQIVLAVLVLAAVCAFTGWAGARAALVASLVFVVVRGLTKLRIGGITGDTAGALVEICETAVLVSLCVWPASWPE